MGGKQALEKMVARIFHSGSEYGFQVEVIDSDWVNAVAFPGGEILIFHSCLGKYIRLPLLRLLHSQLTNFQGFSEIMIFPLNYFSLALML